MGSDAPALPQSDPPGESLPRSHRLRRRGEIKRVQETGQRFAASALVLMILPGTGPARRLGVTVSSKVGNSVVRSKVKRWLREIFRHRRCLLPPSCDVVLVARAAAPGAGYRELTAQFEAAAEKACRRLSKKEAKEDGKV